MFSAGNLPIAGDEDAMRLEIPSASSSY